MSDTGQHFCIGSESQERKLKPSSYNHIINLDDDTHLIFNANTTALIKVESKVFSKIQHLLSNPSTNSDDDLVSNSLQKGGFLIPENEDEKAGISQRLMTSRYMKEYCSVTISPTMGCNFNCSYCFESEEIRAKYDHMDDLTQTQLIKFLHEHFKRYTTKTLEICWFGGEPLLALSAIENISQQLIKIADDLGITYIASIITNGYRLSKKVAETLQKCRVKTAQITLDGPEKIHDSRRYLKGGKGSYKKILKNIKESSDIVDILVRINVDKQNYKFLQQFLQELETESVKKNIKVELAYVHTEDSVNDNSPSVSRKFFSDINLEFTKMTSEEGYHHFRKPSIVTNACGGDQAYSYMIGPKGEIYQCWEDFGNPDLVVGSIFSDKKENNDYVQKYFDFDPTKDPKCTNCTVMPLCMGGCPKHRLMHDGVPQCGVYKFNLKGYIMGLANQQLGHSASNGQKPESIYLYDAFFHPPVPNNFVYLLIPSRFNKEQVINKNASDTLPLNVADEALLDFFESFLDAKQKKSLVDLTQWKSAITNKTNLLGVDYAISVIKYVEKNIIHQPIKAYFLEQKINILDKFIEIPESLSKITRLNLYVKREFLKEVFQKLIYLFGENPDLYNQISKIEIAKENIQTNEITLYPTIILYLDYEILEDSEFLAKFLKKVASFVSLNANFFDYANTEYGHAWLPQVTITQGFKLYKRYLEALGLIYEIYDEHSNFAFTKKLSRKWQNVLDPLI